MRLLLVILLLGSGAPAAADLYTCRKDGKIVYTSHPESSGGDCRLRKSYDPAATPDPAPAHQPEPSQPTAPAAPAASGKENPPGKKAQTVYPTIPAATQRIRATLTTGNSKMPQFDFHLDAMRRGVSTEHFAPKPAGFFDAIHDYYSGAFYMQILLCLLAFLCAYQIWKNSSITEEKRRGFIFFVLSFNIGLLFWGVVLVISIGTVAEFFDWDRRWLPRMILVTIICALIMAAVKVVGTANFLEKLASGEVTARIEEEIKRAIKRTGNSFLQLNKERKILLVGAIIIIMALLFPPSERGSFSFIFLIGLRRIDTTFLLVELLAVIGLVAIAVLYLRSGDAEKVKDTNNLFERERTRD